MRAVATLQVSKVYNDVGLSFILSIKMYIEYDGEFMSFICFTEFYVFSGDTVKSI